MFVYVDERTGKKMPFRKLNKLVHLMVWLERILKTYGRFTTKSRERCM